MLRRSFALSATVLVLLIILIVGTVPVSASDQHTTNSFTCPPPKQPYKKKTIQCTMASHDVVSVSDSNFFTTGSFAQIMRRYVGELRGAPARAMTLAQIASVMHSTS